MHHFPPSRNEWQILTALWELGEGTADEVFARCSFKPRLRPDAAQALLQTMITKGLITQVKHDREVVFLPAVTREEAARISAQKILEGKFTGSLREMLADGFGEIDESELEKLEKLIHVYWMHRDQSK